MEQNATTVLLTCLGHASDAAKAERLASVTPAEWDAVVAQARRHQSAPLLHHHLKRLGVALPGAAADALRRAYLQNAARNLGLYQELGKLLRLLRANDIPVIPLKGALLAKALYENIALRQIGDVDLLVKPADLAKALDGLRTLGYAPGYSFETEVERDRNQHLPRLFKRGELALELHWTIVNPRSNSRFADRDLDQLWSRAVPAIIAGVQVLTLSPEDLLWHLCQHASVQHRFDGAGLRDYWDIALVIRRCGNEINWEQFARHVNQFGIANGVHLALQLTEEWTGVAIPAPVLAALKAAPLDDAIMDWVRHKVLNGTSMVLKSDVARFGGKTRFADKLGVLRDVLFLSRIEMAEMYGPPANSWRILCYYPVRFKDLWMRHSQAMWQLLWHDKALTTEARQEAHLRDYLSWN
ncbi:MAG: nucleotidyltransferase family protein [Chloroflexi bacterium]|nr:nucleotidyltransferase family protein [Chloroflexota bacterium]MBI3733217.1 nucleotidyltransferase family protein [Chloroflexota bacterium]